VLGGLAVGGLLVAGFGGIAMAGPNDCVVESRLRACVPQQYGTDATTDGYGGEYLLEEGSYGLDVGTLRDDGGSTWAYQDWANDSTSSYRHRFTGIGTTQNPTVAQNHVQLRADVSQDVTQYTGGDYRYTHAGVGIGSYDASGTPSASADAWQYKTNDTCSQYAETHVHYGAIGDDGYHPANACPVEVPEIPAVAQLGNPR
jgi:hypothetical protein